MEGVFTAIITPFSEDMSIDEEAMIRLICMQEKAGIKGVVIGGTTGEGWSLSAEEIAYMYEIVRSNFSGKVMIGTGAISTRETIRKTKQAKEMGADAALVIVPYYTFPTEEGVVRHFEEVAKIGLSVIVYHHPKRTGIKLSIEALLRICSISGVVGVKETSGADGYVERLSREVRVFSGNDDEMMKAKKLGASGVISVVSNLFPRETMDFFATDSQDSDWFLSNFLLQLFKEGNPTGIKAALEKKKISRNFLRAPLLPLTDTAKTELYEIMDRLLHKEIANK